jgi:hypothetical protein
MPVENFPFVEVEEIQKHVNLPAGIPEGMKEIRTVLPAKTMEKLERILDL